MANVDFNLIAAGEIAVPACPPLAAAQRGTLDLTVSVHVDMAAVEDDWRALEAQAPISLHQGFDWCDAWSRHHPHQVVVVRGAIAGRTFFILPLEIVQGRIFRIARFIGAPHSNINTGLFLTDRPPVPPETLGPAILSALATKLGRIADIVTLEKMPFEWCGWRHPLAAMPAVRNQNASFQLPLLGDFEATLAQVNAKRRRKKFRVSERRLEALGGYEHVTAGTPCEAHRLLDVFFRQKAERFKANGLPNAFQDAATRNFFHALASMPHRAGNAPLELHAIRLKGASEGAIVAVAGLSEKEGHVICQFGSIDESIAPDSSPGELLFYLMIRDKCQNGATVFDFGIGDQPYKRSWCPQETVLRDIVLPLTLKGHAAAACHRALVRTKAAIKKNRHAYGLIQRLRRRRQGETTIGTDSED
ncbi:GNAT family N-acetyltransferase [Ensifer soli]|uniref:GNAT family N-acetyltransferase n=1 Tax=Ciceribacter sp. sgz301302 TaxID=3342379 RepID=UPI0035B76E91